MSSPKVSIVIPLYNACDFIMETLFSVFGQSYKNIEVIVVDDHSTDGSYEIVQNCDFYKIVLLRNKGKGACAARNHGFEFSTGAYIQFIDADDLLSKDKIERQVAFLENNLDLVAVCSTKHFYDIPENGKITDTSFLFSTDKPSDFLLNLYGANGAFEMVQTSAWLTPRNVIEKAGLWNESLTKDQDGEFFCRVVMASKGIVYVPNVLNYYRKHSGGQNIANQQQRIHIESQLDALNSKAEVLSSFKQSNKYKKAMALQYRFLAINAYPEHKDISKKAMDISESLAEIDYLPVLGGQFIEFLKFTIGWKFAKSFKTFVHKFSILFN